MQVQPIVVLAAGAIALAFFLLVGFLVRVLRDNRRQVAVLVVVATLLGVLPTILIAFSVVTTPVGPSG
ncbi:hypothetical protein [Kitasatospora sp. NPDC004272]